MSKPNPLAGLLANYGDSDEESDDGSRAPPLPPGTECRPVLTAPLPLQNYAKPSAALNPMATLNPLANVYPSATGNASAAAVHPAPIPHCRKFLP